MKADAESKASRALDELDAKLKQLPEDDVAGRNALYEEFLKEHGMTIVAARVRARMSLSQKTKTTDAVPPQTIDAGTDILLTVAPESKDYQLVYDLNLTRLAKVIAYDQDRRTAITGPFDRIAYFIELQREGENLQYLYVSMDAFTTDMGKIGVPTLASCAVFQMNVANMNVISNVNGIVTGTGISGGNIEFWPSNYIGHNEKDVPNAGNGWDFGDKIWTIKGRDGHGSMQVHNHEAQQTLFAINGWKDGGNGADIGIGNNTQGKQDWTFSANAGSYVLKRLRVLVRQKAESGKDRAVEETGTPTDNKVQKQAPPPAGSTAPAPAAATPNANDLVVRYAFDELNGTTATDSSGNGRTAMLKGGALWVAGKSGNAVHLDGKDGYVLLPPGIVSTLNDCTIALWVNLDEPSSKYQRLFDFGTDNDIHMSLTPDAVRNRRKAMRFRITASGVSDAQHIFAVSELPTGVWKHVAFTLAGTTGTLFVDGVEVARDTITIPPSKMGVTTQNYLGKSNRTDPFLKGSVDDFTIYNRALSAAEINALFPKGR